MTYRHRPVAARQRPSAAWHNDLSREVAELSAIIRGAKGGPGVALNMGAGGLLIGLLTSLKDRFYLAKITAAPPENVPIKPSECLYSVAGLDKKVRLEDVEPEYGRQVVGDECWVYPDKVGNLCFLVRNPQSDGQKKVQLWIWNEIPCRGPC